MVARNEIDLDRAPLIVFYELTRACDLVCQHCRACAQSQRDPAELDTRQSMRLISLLTDFQRPPMLVMTGGDPFKRDDLFELITHARKVGLEVAITPSATPLVTEPALRELHRLGIHRLAVSLDGVDAATHDAFRGVSGSYARTFEIIETARRIGIPLQINTTLVQSNVHQIDAMANLLAGQQIVLWSVFFLVPVGRGLSQQRLDAEQCENAFVKLHRHAQTQSYAVKTTEAPHYRRYVLQQKKSGDPNQAVRPSAYAAMGVNDGKGIMFISHTGQMYPSGFLPLECGRFPLDTPTDVYQRSSLFMALRDASRLEGKCGWCEYRQICGGSRARSFALTNDPFASEPDCIHQPRERHG